ncbi:hypothetical protein GF373_15545 [bacterium]|nr:hypothetical protein [bacterium]
MLRLFSFSLVALVLAPIFCFGEVEPIPSRVGLRDVEVGGEIGRRIEITVHNNIFKIDVDGDFLRPFQERKRKSGYIGLGKFIDSLVRFAAHTENGELIALKDRVIRETIATQEPDGYIGMFVEEARMWKLWDIHEMAYIVNGLVSDYHFFRNKTSLEAAQTLMDYIIRRWEANPDGLDTFITEFMAVTGLEETLLMLYDETKDEQYLNFCRDFRQLPQWDYPIVMGRWGDIGGHAYAFFHRCLAQLRLHQIEPAAALPGQTQKAMRFLLEQDGLLINGVCSQHECWHDTQDGTAGLGETCATAYLIRVLDERIRMEGDSLYGDMMERSIYNGLFAAQSPDGRRLRYYVPFEGKRVFFDGDTYCCPCNYRRIVAELPSMIYYKMGEGIAVNLFAPSTATLELADGGKVTIGQETDYPNSGDVAITLGLSRSVEFPLFLRIPRWCEEGTVAINDEVKIQAQGGRYVPISRTWRDGDRVTLHLPMPLRLVKGRKAQAGRVAVMRGPQLYCLNPSRNEGLEGVDLREVIIDPETLAGPFTDASVRPNGTAVRVKGWKKMGFTTGGNHQLELSLTEFPDPDGEFTYFRIRRLGRVGVRDELMR